MKAISGVFVAVAAVLVACGAMNDEGAPRPPAEPDVTEDGRVSAFAARDCTVSIVCTDGSTRSCRGTLGNCAASGSGNGRVTCNGITTYCPTPPPLCAADGVCDATCDSDPDCAPCAEGAFCTSNATCGVGGYCINRVCRCDVAVR